MIPATSRTWRLGTSLPLPWLHPATRLGSGMLAVLSALLLPLPLLLPLAGVLSWMMWRSGWHPDILLARWRVWMPVLVIVLAAHTLSAVDAAPLGTATWVGLVRGFVALGRLALMLVGMALTIRLLPLPMMSAALDWWLRPMRRFGWDGRHLNLLLAVAVGTMPRTLDEASRLRDCLRLRLGDAGNGGHHSAENSRSMRHSFLHRCHLLLKDRRLRACWLVMPPLYEGLVRRADSLPLALFGRVPHVARETWPLPLWQAFLMIIWTVLLVLVAC